MYTAWFGGGACGAGRAGTGVGVGEETWYLIAGRIAHILLKGSSLTIGILQPLMSRSNPYYNIKKIILKN